MGWEYINDLEVDAASIKREQLNILASSVLSRITGIQTVFAFFVYGYWFIWYFR